MPARSRPLFAADSSKTEAPYQPQLSGGPARQQIRRNAWCWRTDVGAAHEIFGPYATAGNSGRYGASLFNALLLMRASTRVCECPPAGRAVWQAITGSRLVRQAVSVGKN